MARTFGRRHNRGDSCYCVPSTTHSAADGSASIHPIALRPTDREMNLRQATDGPVAHGAAHVWRCRCEALAMVRSEG